MIAIAFAVAALVSQPSVSTPGLDLARAERNLARLMAGSAQVYQLTPIEIRELRLLFDLRAGARRAGETRSVCLERELSAEPTQLELAIADLKCSQRPE